MTIGRSTTTEVQWRPGKNRHLILAEIQMRRRIADERVFKKPLAAFRAEVVAGLLINLIANLVTCIVVHLLENLVNLRQVVAVVVVATIPHHSVRFQSDDVPKIAFRVDDSFTAVASVVNHGTQNPSLKISGDTASAGLNTAMVRTNDRPHPTGMSDRLAREIKGFARDFFRLRKTGGCLGFIVCVMRRDATARAGFSGFV